MMTSERWEQIKQLFDQVADRSADERSIFLDQACQGDKELRREVESLFESEEQDVSIVDREPFDLFSQLLTGDLRETREGLVLGQYRLLEEIGRGGMAVVYSATRVDEQFQQQVAIKLIRQGMDNKMMIARFRQERQILANLDHPHIAQLFDGGVTSEGLPYLVMELIDGEPIDMYCDRRNLSLTDRLELFRDVCSAVRYAHRNLVIHRDLKPSNILVTKEGAPKLLDFGIAKLIEPVDDMEELAQVAQPALTEEGSSVMTLEYASPEQVAGLPVTIPSDIYALGVLLYQLLTGRRPYEIGLMTRSEIERVIREQNPERPSTAIVRPTPVPRSPEESSSTSVEISRRRGGSPNDLRRKLRGDLDNIVLMAMRKEPERRYGSVEQLDGDVRRYLEGLPVIARDNTVSYLVSKFVQRHSMGVAAAVFIFLLLVGSVVATTWQMRIAQKERLTAQKVSSFMVDLFELSDPEKAQGREIPARDLLDRSVEELAALSGQPEVQAELMNTIGRVYINLGMLEEAKPMLTQALEIRQQTLPKNDPAITESQSLIANLLADQGRYEEAERLFRVVLKQHRRLLNESDERLIESEIDLADVLEQRGRLDEAENLLRQALDHQRSSSGKNNEQIAKTFNILALVLRGKSRFHEAAALYREALDIIRNQLSTTHPDYANTLNNLAEVLCDQGDHDEALTLFEQVETLQVEVLGREHWSLATTWNNIALCKRNMRDFEGAETLYRNSLELGTKVLGPNHPYVAACLNNLGNLYYQKGELMEAEPLLRRALYIYEESPGGPHFDRASPLNNLALVLQDIGRLSEAEELHRQALTMNRQLYGDSHERIARNLNNLGEVLRRLGKSEEAASHFRQALEVGRKVFGPESLEIATVHLNLANLLRSMKQLGPAETEYRMAWNLRRKILGLRHPMVANSTVGLGRILMEQGQPEQAEPLLREALEILKEEQQQPNLAMAQATLGRCLTSLGRFVEARHLLETSYDTFDRIYGRHGKWTTATKQWINEIALKTDRS